MKAKWLFLAAAVLVSAWVLVPAGCAPAQPGPAAAPAQAVPAAAPDGGETALTIEERLAAPAGVTAVRLSNDTTVIVKPIRTAPVVAVRAYVHTGSLYEGQWLGCGLSHLLEHLVAGGEDVPVEANAPSRAKQTAAKIGGQSNAYTSMDETCYHIAAAAGKTDECIDYIAEMMADPGFTKEDFEREHGVVQRELELGRDNPGRQMGEAHSALVYRTHPAVVPIIGYKKALAEVTWDDVVRYHAKMYCGQNVVFVVAGDVDVDKVLDRCRKSLAGLKTGRQPDLSLPEAQPLAGVSRSRLTNTEIKETSEHISFLSIPLLHEDLYALDLLSTVLAEGQTSRLYEKIKRQLNLVTSVGSGSYTPNWGKGQFSISFTTSPDKADAAEKAILDELRAFVAGSVKEEELTRAKRIKVAEFVYSQQTAEQQASMIASDYLTTGDMDFSARYTKKIQSVTAEQVLAAAKKYLTQDAMAITRMDPAGTAATRPAAGTVGTTTAPVAKEESRLLTLPNGLRVVLHASPSVRLVSMVLVTEGGLLLETPANNGMGTLMTMLSTKGAGKRTAEEISDFFDRAGGGISAGCNNNTFLWDATVLDDSFEKALEVFADVVQKPTFPDKELGIYRENLLKQIARVREDLVGEAMYLSRQKFFAGSPYRLLPTGDANVVGPATVGQIAKYHTDCLKAGSSVLAIYGNFDMAAAAKAVEALFGAMPKGKAELKLAEFRTGAAGDSLTVETTKKQGSAVVFFQPGMKIQDVTDRLPLDVLDTIISGYRMPAGWLHNELRGKQLVYVVHAYNWAGLAPGAFVTYAACQPDKAPEVVAIIRKNLDKAAAFTPTADQIAEAVNTILTAEILDSQEMKDLAMSAALNELYGLGYDFLQKLEEKYRKVTPADVHRVAEKYFGKGYSVLVTTPKPEAFGSVTTAPAK